MKTPKQHIREAEIIQRASIADKIAKLNKEKEENSELNLKAKNATFNL